MVSEERIASNVLADRLKMLVSEDFSPEGRPRTSVCHLQAHGKGISIFPVIAQIGLWGRHNLPNSELNARGQAILEGGPKMWARFMDELRESHLGVAENRHDAAA